MLTSVVLRRNLLTSFILLNLAAAPVTFGADATWISTSSTSWGTGANWSGGFPGATTGAILADGASIQHTLDIGVSLTTVLGIQFSSFAGGSGFIVNGTGGNPFGFKLQNGGSANGIINNDDSTQTFNVPIGLYTFTGFFGGAQTWNANSGSLVFSGIYSGSASTVANNGGRLTITGGFDVTIGSGSGRGDIVGSGGLTKSGAGTLFLGGTIANAYSGLTIVNEGTIQANKANAFGTSSLLLNGGQIATGGFDQTFGTLAIEGSVTLDLGEGASDLNFAASTGTNWLGNLLITGWSEGSDSVRFGSSDSALTADQLSRIHFDIPGLPNAALDPNGFLIPVPVPEPSVVSLSVLGGFGLVMLVLRRGRS